VHLKATKVFNSTYDSHNANIMDEQEISCMFLYRSCKKRSEELESDMNIPCSLLKYKTMESYNQPAKNTIYGDRIVVTFG
jgi:hypothetical protein